MNLQKILPDAVTILKKYMTWEKDDEKYWIVEKREEDVRHKRKEE